MTAIRRLSVNISLALVSLAAALFLAEILYRLYEIARSPAAPDEPHSVYMRYDSVVGWRPIPGAAVGQTIFDQWGGRVGGREEINRPLGEKRIAAFGDSFTFGHGLAGSDTWPAHLENRTAGHGYSVVNLGVPAYGIDQMYLLYREVRQDLRPEIILVGIISWDIQRVPKTRRREGGRQKPMFIFEKGELKLTNIPVPLVTGSGMERISAGDILLDTGRSYILDRIHPPENRLRWPEISEEEYSAENIELNKYARGLFLSQKIIERWKEEAEAEGRRLILVLIPTRNELEWYRSYLVRLKENLAGKGLEIVDCQEVFREKDQPGVNLFLGNHPSSRGQDVIAEQIYSYLADTGSFPDGPGVPGGKPGESPRP